MAGLAATLTLEGKSLAIQGGYDAGCESGRGTTELDGGGLSTPIFSLTGPGSAVTLRNLTIRGGSGGAVLAHEVDLVLEDTILRDNRALHGGGIAISGGSLRLAAGSVIETNEASEDGGGIWCSNAVVQIDMRARVGGALSGNAADADRNGSGQGGGLFLDDCELLLGQVEGPARVDGNSAMQGGGIAATAGSRVELTGMATIGDNSARDAGGGIYLAGDAVAILNGARIERNVARSTGGGLFASGTATTILMPAQACSTPPCVRLNANTAARGAALALQAGATLDAEALLARDNHALTAGAVLHAQDAGTNVTIDNALLHDNESATTLVELADEGVYARLKNTTIARNRNQGSVLGLQAGSSLQGYALILWDNHNARTIAGTGAVGIECSVLQEPWPDSGILVIDPKFRSPADGDFHLLAASPAIDLCQGAGSADIDGDVRPHEAHAMQPLPAPLPRPEQWPDASSAAAVEANAGAVGKAFENAGSLQFNGTRLLRLRLRHRLDDRLMSILAGRVALVHYAGDNTFIARATAAGLARIPPGVISEASMFTPALDVHGRDGKSAGLHYLVQSVTGRAAVSGSRQPVSASAEWLSEHGAQVLSRVSRTALDRSLGIETMQLKLSAAAFADLAQLPGLLAAQPAMQDRPLDELSDQIVADNTVAGEPFGGYSEWLAQLGIDGGGIVVALVDTGADWDHEELPIVSGTEYGGSSEPGEPGSDPGSQGHGTHVAGIIAGTGSTGAADSAGFLYGLGVAPGAQLHVQDAIGFISTERAQRVRDSLRSGAALSNNSWGSTTGTGYDLATAEHDALVLDAIDDDGTRQVPFLTIFAAGNGGDDCGEPPCLATISNPAEAKNLVAVGATDSKRLAWDAFPSSRNINNVAVFSSRGPALDGRVKPDVMAPGNSIISTRNSAGASLCAEDGDLTSSVHAYCSGTSVAAPHVSGIAALFAQRYRLRTQSTRTPLPSLFKAALLASTDDLGGNDDGYGGVIGARPDPHQGWGRVNAARLLSPGVAVRYYESPFLLSDPGQTWSVAVTAYDASEAVRISLAWSDPPAAENAPLALVNDLDLSVATAAGGSWLGNAFGADGWSASGGDPDRLNNVENVWIEQPPAGEILTVSVQAHALNGDARLYDADTTDQFFSLVCHNCSEVLSGVLDAGADEWFASNAAPALDLLSPAAGARVLAGHGVHLAATAHDPDEGDLSAVIAWTSNRDGSLGSGASLDRRLSSGVHRLTASVRNQDGLTTTTAVSLTMLRGCTVSAPATLDFGTTAVGLPLSRPVLVTNTGDSECVLDEPQFGSGGSFGRAGNWPAPPLLLAPGTAALLPIAWQPQQAGFEQGSFSLLSNDPERPVLRVLLYGQATAPGTSP